MFVPGPRLRPPWHLSGTVPLIHTAIYAAKNEWSIAIFFSWLYSVRESETAEDPFPQILQRRWSAHVIALTQPLGRFGEVQSHLTHPHTRVQIQSRRNARPCSLGHTSLSDLVHITCVCTPGQGKPLSLHSSGLVIFIYDAATNLAQDPGCKKSAVGRAQHNINIMQTAHGLGLSGSGHHTNKLLC